MQVISIIEICKYTMQIYFAKVLKIVFFKLNASELRNMPREFSFWSEQFMWVVLCSKMDNRGKQTTVGWEPLGRLQLSNVTESQTRGASCVVRGSGPTPLFPLFPL